MPTDDQTFAERLRVAINSIIAGKHVCNLGLVQSVSGASPNIKLTVQPMVAAIDKDGIPRPYNVVNDVPLFPIGGGGWRLDVTPGSGDIVLLIFADRPLDDWKRTKSTTEPTGKRSHALQDAVAIPIGVGSGASSGIALTHSSGSPAISLTSTGTEITGNLDVTGLVQVGTINPPTAFTVNTHVHPAGTPNTGAPIDPV